MDENRRKAQSMDDIRQLTQTTLPFAFGISVSGAANSSTLPGDTNADAKVNSEPGVSSNVQVPITTHSSSTEMVAKNDTQAPGDKIGLNGAAQASTSNQTQRPATLNDVKNILNSNSELFGA